MSTSDRILMRVSFGLLAISALLNIYYWLSPHIKNIRYLSLDPNRKAIEIQNYLDRISPEFITDVQTMAEKEKIPSWGCGPSSYAIAKIINKKFFNNSLKISATYDGLPYQIVERFGFGLKDGFGVDHNWLEIYLKDKLMFVDPTIGQFGIYNKIVYEIFALDDPDLSAVLKEKYGIIDVRLSLTVKKALNRIPADQDPYPGISIDKSRLDYYIAVLNARNEVDAGKEPADWKDWVTALTNKYK